MDTNMQVTLPSVFTIIITSMTATVHFYNDLYHHHYHTVVIVMAVIPISLSLFSRKKPLYCKRLAGVVTTASISIHPEAGFQLKSGPRGLRIVTGVQHFRHYICSMVRRAIHSFLSALRL